MLQTILQYFSFFFPHTFARLAHWHLLLFYDKAGLLDHHDIVIAILPTCIYHTVSFARDHVHLDDDDDEGPLENQLGPFRVVNECIAYGSFVYKVFDLAAAVELLLRTSGFCGKTLLAIDLLVENALVFLAKFIFFVSVGVVVGAALEGFPYVEDLTIAVWMSIKLGIFTLEEPLREGFEGNEGPADDQLHEE